MSDELTQARDDELRAAVMGALGDFASDYEQVDTFLSQTCARASGMIVAAEAERDAMREALRRLGDDADLTATADCGQAFGHSADELVKAVRAARDLYAPKESGQ